MMTGPLHEADPDALHPLFVAMPHACHQGLMRLWVDAVHMGYLLPSTASIVHGLCPTRCVMTPDHDLYLDTGATDVQSRSDWMQHLAVQLHQAGLINGWRNEPYDAHTPHGEVFFQMERGAFRTLGLISQAVHIHGSTPSGHVWVAQRSLSKATDPGLWDNLAAGGLPHGQTPMQCAQRELWEEAGLDLPLTPWPFKAPSAGSRSGGHLSERREPDGVHREWLHVFTAVVPAGVSPVNQDGEVQGFELLSPAALIERLNRLEFTWDAAWVSALCLGFSVKLADREKMPQLTHKLAG